MAIYCCMDCAVRYPGCHDKCDTYRREKAHYGRIKRQMARDDNVVYDMYYCGQFKNKVRQL